MLIPILFGVVVLAVVIGVWIYRGTKEKKGVDAVTGPEYDPGKVVTTAAAEESKRAKTVSASAVNDTHAINRSADVNLKDKSEPEIGVYQESDVQTSKFDTPETGNTHTHLNNNTGTAKNESFEGSGEYTPNKDKQIVNKGLEKDPNSNAPDKLEHEHTVNTGNDANKNDLNNPKMP